MTNQAGVEAEHKFKSAYTLISFYEKLYKQKYNNKPTINRYKEKWSALSVIEDYGLEKSKKLVEYYFRLSKDNHPFQWMVTNFDVILKAYEASIKDEQIRAERRAQTAKLKEEFLNGNA